MSFSVRCQCGKTIPVSETDAGALLECTCGEVVQVPALSELRRQAGLPAYTASAADQIAYMLAHRELPQPQCAGCGMLTEETVDASVDCEKTWTKDPSVLTHVFVALVSPWIWAIWSGQQMYRQEGREFGRGLTVYLPLRLCSACREAIRPSIWLRVSRPCKWAFLVLGVGIVLFYDIRGLYLVAGAAVPWAMERSMKNARQAVIHRFFMRVPIYQQLLEEYPKAEIVIHSPV